MSKIVLRTAKDIQDALCVARGIENHGGTVISIVPNDTNLDPPYLANQAADRKFAIFARIPDVDKLPEMDCEIMKELGWL